MLYDIIHLMFVSLWCGFTGVGVMTVFLSFYRGGVIDIDFVKLNAKKEDKR
jgi:hypothetical protein